MTDTTVDSLKIQETVAQILCTYEALMAYVVNSWTTNDPPQIASKLIFLHKSYHSVADFAKVGCLLDGMHFFLNIFSTEISLLEFRKIEQKKRHDYSRKWRKEEKKYQTR